MKLNFRRFVAILLVAMMTLTALPTAGIAEITGASRGVSLRSVVQPGEGDVYVTYNFMVGESVHDTQIVKNGGTVTEPATPKVPEGKRFEGWYEGNTPFTFGTVSATENKTVTVEARFTDVYYVYFMTVDGNVFATAEAVAPNYTVALPDNYEPEGKRVTGWKTENGAFTANTKVTADTTVVPEVVDCYWVTFDSQGGEVLPSKYVDKGDTLNLSRIRPTRTGYTFKGWSETANGNVITSVTPNSDVILYAVWTPAQVNYTVVYWGENANDTDYGTFLGSVTKKDYTGKTVTASNSIPSSIKNRNYFKFVSSDKQEVKADGSTVVTVLCSRNEYTLTFDLGENREHKLTMGGKTYTGGSNTKYFIKAKYEADIESRWPTVANFETNSGFAGWSTSNDWSWGDTWVSKRINMTAELCSQGTVYATYGAKYTHELNYMFESFDQTSGENGKERKRYGGVYYDRSAEYTQTVMADTSREFGFKEISGMKSQEVTSSWINGVRVTYLYYTRNEYTLTLNNYGATTTTKLKYGAAINNPDTPSRPDGFSENAVFKGWYTVDVKNIGESTKPYDFTDKTMPAENMTLFAYWEEAKVNLTVDYGTGYTDEKKIGTKIFDFGSYTAAVTQINQDGKRVLKWVDKETGETYTVNQPIAKDTTITPIFAGDTYWVTYVLNGDNNTTVKDERNYGYESKAKVLPGSNEGAPEGKAFAYWQDEAGNVYRPGQYLTMTANVTLTAVYTDIHGKVSLTYHSNFHPDQTYTTDEMPDNGEVTVATYPETKLPDRAGYNFLGWNTDSQAKTADFAPEKVVRLEGNGNDLYAIWEARTDTKYTVEFYHQNTDGTYPTEANASVERRGTTDTVVEVESGDKNPRENNKYVWDETASNITSGTVSAVEPLVLKLYFKLNTAQYTIHHYLLGTTIPVAAEQRGEMTIGEELKAEPASEDVRMAGTNAVKYEPAQTITISADPNANVITVYYTKNVTFTGQSDTRTYTGSEQGLIGIEVEGLLNGDTWTGLSYSAKGTNVGEYKGAFTGELKIMHAGKEATYYNVTKTPGMLEITPITDEVIVTITGNHDSKVYNGSEQSVTGYTTDVGEKTITVALKEGKAAEAKGTNAGKYYMGLKEDDFTVTSANYSNIKVVVVDGYLDITPITDEVTVTITGNHDSKVYNGSEQSVTGYTTDVGEKTINVTLDETGKDTARGTNANTYPMGLTEADFTVTSENYSNIKVVVVDGYLEITPITEEVTVTITGNHGSKVYNGSEQSVTGYTTDVGEKTINVALKEDSKAEAKGTDVGTYNMGLTADDFTVTSDNYSNIKVVVNDGSLKITPITEKVTVTIEGHKGTFKYDGTEHTVTGYDVTGISNPLYTKADFTFSGTAEVKEKNASESAYPMGLDASQFTNVSGNFSNVEFVVTDGEMTINPRNITIRAKDNTVEYDGKPHGENGYTLEDDGLAEGEKILGLVIDGEQTEAGSYPGELKPHDALIGAEGEEINPKNYKIDYANGNLEITPVAAEVVVTITEHGGKAKYDGTEHVVTGYDVTSISNPLYTEGNFTFNGKAEVKGIDAGSYPMLLKSADFVNTSKNFAKVTFVIVDATLEIEKREVTLTSASDEKVYDGKALTNDEVTVSGDGFAEDEGAYCGVTGRQLNVGESDNEFTYELLRRTKAGNYKITKEYGTLKVTPVTEEVVVTITGHKGSAKYDGSEKTVTGYDVTGISNPLYTENDFTFSGDATASGIHAGKYPMGLKAEDFKNTSENFANVKFVVEDGEMEIQKIALTITSESYEGDYDAQWHQVGYTAEGLAATDAITALEMKNHRILKPGEMVSEFVANTLKITHADGSDATGDYEVTFVPGKLTVNTVIVNYRVFYYYDGVLDESEIEEGTGEVLTQITEYKDKPKDMQFDHVTGFPLTLGLDEMKNIIRVYYVHTPLTGNLGAANIGDCIE